MINKADDNRQRIREAIKSSILDNKDFEHKIPIPPNANGQIDDIALSLSSVDFIDLLIEVEQKLDIELSENCMTLSQISIGELIDRIEENV